MLQAAAQSSNLSEDREAAHQDAATRLVSRSGPEGSQPSDPASEVARFGAIKEKKHSLEAGIQIFNRSLAPVPFVSLHLPRMVSAGIKSAKPSFSAVSTCSLSQWAEAGRVAPHVMESGLHAPIAEIWAQVSLSEQFSSKPCQLSGPVVCVPLHDC